MAAKDDGRLKEQGWYKALSEKECTLLKKLIDAEKQNSFDLNNYIPIENRDFTINDEFTINGK